MVWEELLMLQYAVNGAVADKLNKKDDKDAL
jgi:hypothetical protein